MKILTWSAVGRLLGVPSGFIGFYLVANTFFPAGERNRQYGVGDTVLPERLRNRDYWRMAWG